MSFGGLCLSRNLSREFPGNLVVRIPGFHRCGLGSVPGRRTEIPGSCAAWPKKKKEKEKEICPFHLSCQIHWHKVELPYYLFNIYRIFRDVSSLIPVFSLLSSLFLLTSVAKGFSILLIFSENQLLVSLIFFYCVSFF